MPSPKTAHHAGGESRLIPLFPELRPHLEAAFNEAEPGSKHVISHHRTGNANLRTQFQRILEKAGIPAWPKLFHNLRATRQTELAADFPLHVVCRWIGNSTEIANKHYLSVTENDYLRGAGLGDDQSKGSEAAQNAAQQAHASSRTESQAKSPTPVILGDLLGCAAACESVQAQRVPRRGVEHGHNSSQRIRLGDHRSAGSSALNKGGNFKSD